MPTLVPGANTPIPHTPCQVVVTSQNASRFGIEMGCVWIAMDASRRATTSPAYLHESKDWAALTVESEKSHVWTLDLANVFSQNQTQHLQLIVYAYQDASVIAPAVEVNDLGIKVLGINVASDIDYAFHTTERHIKASIVLEIYQRNGQYKCRALAETSSQSLASFAERLQISLDARYPNNMTTGNVLHAIPDNRRPRPQAGDTWTGTSFAIDPYHLLTCEHVVDGATQIALRQQGYPDMECQVVLADEGSDTALLKVNQPLPSYLPVRERGYDLLGEQITTLGFPLTGLGSQLQVTQGNIAGLQGIGNDIRFMQFTAPIQPGSSGSPLLLPTGEVVGMVTHTIANTQNMNYAVKYQLLSALLTSCGLNVSELTHNISQTPLSTPQITKQSKSALWLVGCGV